MIWLWLLVLIVGFVGLEIRAHWSIIRWWLKDLLKEAERDPKYDERDRKTLKRWRSKL